MTIAIIGIVYIFVVLVLTRFVHVLHQREERMREGQLSRLPRHTHSPAGNPRAAA